MRLFFPLISAHQIIPDWDGVEVTHANEAQAAALEVLKALRDDSSVPLDLSGWTLRAVDASCSVVFSLDLDIPIQ